LKNYTLRIRQDFQKLLPFTHKVILVTIEVKTRLKVANNEIKTVGVNIFKSPRIKNVGFQNWFQRNISA